MKLPHDKSAEESYLGSVFKDNRVLRDYPLPVAAFHTVSYQYIMESMIRLSENGEGIDMVTVVNDMKKAGTFEKGGGFSTISYLACLVPTVAFVKQYVDILREKFRYREIVKLGQALGSSAIKETPVDEILDYGQRELARIILSEKPEADKRRDYIDFMDWVGKRQAEGTESGIKSGLKALDDRIHGWQKGDLIFLAARPGMGKTALALNFAYRAAKDGSRSISVYSLEMPKNQIIARLCAIHSPASLGEVRRVVTVDKLINPELMTEQETSDTLKIVGELDQINLRVIDGVYSLPKIINRLRREAVKGLDMAVIDYLQLIETERRENRVQELTYITKALKRTALELNIPILCLSQLSRAVETRSDKRPVLSDLRESGSIEQDADMVMLMYRDKYYKEDGDAWTELNIAKFRNGIPGVVKLMFAGSIMSFTGLSNLDPAAYGVSVNEKEVAV